MDYAVLECVKILSLRLLAKTSAVSVQEHGNIGSNFTILYVFLIIINFFSGLSGFFGSLY